MNIDFYRKWEALYRCKRCNALVDFMYTADVCGGCWSGSFDEWVRDMQAAMIYGK